MMFRPRPANCCWRVVKFAFPEGKSLEASEASETLPSFLPVKTCHMGRPNCTSAMKDMKSYKKRKTEKKIICVDS